MATQLAISGAEHFAERDHTGDIIQRALLDPALPAEKVAVLLDVQLRYEANEARKRFEHAFQLFKTNPPSVLKTKHVRAGQLQYSHAELDKISEAIGDGLLAVGITQTWTSREENGRTVVQCVLNGHGHTHFGASLAGPPDTSGGKNSVQAIGSTYTYLQRYTLLATIGIAPKNTDDDGRTEGMAESAVDAYCNKLRDAENWDELKHAFHEAYSAAEKANDLPTMKRFSAVKEECKRKFTGGRQ